MPNIESAGSIWTGIESCVHAIRHSRRLLWAGLICAASLLSAQPTPYAYSTISGVAAKAGSANGTGGGSNLPLFNHPFGLVLNSAGNLVVADASNGLIRLVTPGGVVTTLAGNPGLIGGVDGNVSTVSVSFNSPQSVAVDGAGNLYVADYNGATIRKITSAGVVSTIAGSALLTGTADGAGADARFSRPAALAADPGGNVYVADSGNHTIRKITPAGVVSVFAGTAGSAGAADGTGSTARFNNPRGLAADGAGNLYVADTANNIIRKITSSGIVTTLAGQAGSLGSVDGTGIAARFSSPMGLTVDGAGNLFVADEGNNTVRKITPAGVTTTLAGSAGNPGLANGTASAARFSAPIGVAVDGVGNIYVSDYNNQLIRKISPANVVTTIAGVGGASGFLDGSGFNLSAALFRNPSAISIAPGSIAYVADTGNNIIRRIATDGTVSTLAGSSTASGITDGTGSEARFSSPGGVVADSNGDVYVADTANHVIRKITSAGVVTTFAGKAQTAGATDAAGADARFNFPSGVAVDLSGNLYVADYDNHVVRKITPAGVVSTLAGSAGASGSANGAGATARFNFPRSVAVDAVGKVYVADSGNHAIRVITAAGVVTTLAGQAGSNGSADGQGSAARFNGPAGIAVDGAGNVYVTDSNNSIIRFINPAGLVTTVGGTSGGVGSTDGIGAAARFNNPTGLALDAAGNIYIADNRNQTIRLGLATGNTTGIGASGSGTGSGSGSSSGSGTGSGSGSGSDSGSGSTGGSGSGTGTTPPSPAYLLHPSGMITDVSGNLLVTDTANNCLKVITGDGTVTVFAGKEGTAGTADGTGTTATFNGPTGITTDNAGNYYVCDTGNATIRKVTSTGVVTTLAGSAASRGSQDGTGSGALFHTPTGIVYNGSNASLYVTDSVGSTIRKVTADGVVTTYAGTAQAVGDADGPGTAARFNNPTGLAIDLSYSLYVADTYNSTIRKIPTKRFVRATAAGSIVDAGTVAVVLTDPGLAGSPITLNVDVAAGDIPTIWAPKVATALAANTTIAARYSVVAAGEVIVLTYLVDDEQPAANLSLANGTSTGITASPTSLATAAVRTVSTLAGSAGISGIYDGAGIYALFNQPKGLAVDQSGNVYVADTGNSCLRRITSRGAVTTLAGISGIAGFRDGAGNTALFNQPAGVFTGGTIFVVDTGNSTIRSYSTTTANVSSLTLKAATTDTTASSSTSSSGGGGAPSGWFFAALIVATAVRRWKRAS